MKDKNQKTKKLPGERDSEAAMRLAAQEGALPARKPYEFTADESRVLRAVSSMPYGASMPSISGGGHLDTPLEMHAIATYLEALRERLVVNAAAQRDDQTQLAVYRAAISGLRDLVSLVKSE